MHGMMQIVDRAGRLLTDDEADRITFTAESGGGEAIVRLLGIPKKNGGRVSLSMHCLDIADGDGLPVERRHEARGHD